jgi:hypothetical protein
MIHRKTLFAAAAVLITLALAAPQSAHAAATAKQLSTNFTLVNLDKDNPATGAISYLLESGAAWPGVSAGNLSFSLPANGGSIQIKQYFDPTMQPGRGSVVIASDRPVGAIVQIQARGQVPTQGAYTGFLEGHSVYYVPLAARNRYTLSGTGNSQIIIQNADSAAVTVTVELIPNTGSSGTYTRTIPSIQPGVSYYYDLSTETNLPDNWIGSAVVTALDSRKVTVVSNFFQGPDILQTFNAFPQEEIGPEWIVPIFFSRLENGMSTVITARRLRPGRWRCIAGRSGATRPRSWISPIPPRSPSTDRIPSTRSATRCSTRSPGPARAKSRRRAPPSRRSSRCATTAPRPAWSAPRLMRRSAPAAPTG